MSKSALFQPDDRLKITEFGFQEKPEYREVSQSERLNLCEEYLFVDDDLLYYSEQKKQLRIKYLDLNKQLEERINRCKASKARLRDAVRYCLISVDPTERESRASRPTSMLGSQKLQELAGSNEVH